MATISLPSFVHNVIMTGPPGAGKTLLARALPSILPRLTIGEALDVTRVYSVADQLPVGTPLIQHRPRGGRVRLCAGHLPSRGIASPRVWLVFRRTLGAKPEIKFYFSNAPTLCPRGELIRVSGLRWPVETALEEGKGEGGMDH